MVITKIQQLNTTIWICKLCIGYQDARVREDLAKVLSYIFSVEMPEPDSEGEYRFPKESIKKIESQLDGISVAELARARLNMETLVLMTNSPRFPYTLHTNSMFEDNKHWVYYRFIIKRDIILDKDTRKTVET